MKLINSNSNFNTKYVETYAVETIVVESVQHGVITETGSILMGEGGGQVKVLFRPYRADTI